jgi:hypothetical protein
MSDDVARQLRDAWNQQPTPERTDRPGCVSHLPPFDAVTTPDKTRTGWMRVQCRRCGRFLGYCRRS